MVALKRKIGAEILEGLRQLKRGEHGRGTTVPSVTTVREGTGSRSRGSLSYSASRFARCRSGSRAGEHRRAPLGRSCSSRPRTRAR